VSFFSPLFWAFFCPFFRPETKELPFFFRVFLWLVVRIAVFVRSQWDPIWDRTGISGMVFKSVLIEYDPTGIPAAGIVNYKARVPM
jgi:hypothetical protein